MVKNYYLPDYVSHPGETLKELLEEWRIKPIELSARIGIDVRTITNIIDGSEAIGEEVAKGLEREFKVPKSFWLTRQRHYEKAQLRINNTHTHSK